MRSRREFLQMAAVSAGFFTGQPICRCGGLYIKYGDQGLPAHAKARRQTGRPAWGNE